MKQSYYQRYQRLSAKEDENQSEIEIAQSHLQVTQLQGGSADEINTASQPLYQKLDQGKNISQQKVALLKHMEIQFPDNSTVIYPDHSIPEDRPSPAQDHSVAAHSPLLTPGTDPFSQ